ncbi:MAG: AAA family ATPase, partial [Neobacillus sp.]
FEIPKPTADFNYVHCGFTNSGGHLKTREEFEKQFLVTWATIHQNGRLKRWHQVLRNFMDNDIISKLNIINFKDDKGLDRWRVNSEGYHEIKKILSSGQNILLYIISEITANLRYDSLVLYDEPETHLHPNAITQLISSVHGLIEEFESFCIIATHSPLVIRELPSKSVFIIEKFENTPTVRKIGLESFGGNLGTLTEDVFGNREITKTHELIVEDLVQQKYTYDQIIEILQTEDIPVNLNVRLYAKSLLKERQ